MTKVTPKAGRHRMDRIYVSPDVAIIDAGVYDGRPPADMTDLRTLTCGSDHGRVGCRAPAPQGEARRGECRSLWARIIG